MGGPEVSPEEYPVIYPNWPNPIYFKGDNPNTLLINNALSCIACPNPPEASKLLLLADPNGVFSDEAPVLVERFLATSLNNTLKAQVILGLAKNGSLTRIALAASEKTLAVYRSHPPQMAELEAPLVQIPDLPYASREKYELRSHLTENTITFPDAQNLPQNINWGKQIFQPAFLLFFDRTEWGELKVLRIPNPYKPTLSTMIDAEIKALAEKLK